MKTKEDVIIYPSIVKNGLLCLLSVTFLVLLLGFASSEGGGAGIWVVLGLFGFTGVFSLLQLLGFSSLRLHKEGMEWTHLKFRKFKVLWTDIEEIGLITRRKYGLPVGKHIAYNLVPSARSKISKTNQFLNKAFRTYDCVIPFTWQIDSKKLEALLIEFWSEARVNVSSSVVSEFNQNPQRQ